MTKTLSLVVPCYCEEETIPLFYAALQKVKPKLPDLEFEYWFVNDGSSDNTLEVMRNLQQQDPEHVHYASFSRNFGKEAGLYCGLQQATGDYVAVMDVDLQDPPEMLVDMYADIKTGKYDCVGCRRTTRDGEPPIRSFFARMFYKLINKISDTEIVDGARDFRLMTRQMVDAILEMSEYNRFSKGIFSWVGFNTKYLPYHNVERVAGTTSWNFWSLFKYSIEGIVAFSEAPLLLATVFGLLCLLAAAIGIIWIIATHCISGNPTEGWSSLACMILFFSGVQLLCLGIIGRYVGNVYLEVKHRPIYIIKEKK